MKIISATYIVVGRDRAKKSAIRTTTIDEGDFQFEASWMGLEPIYSSSCMEMNSSNRQFFMKIKSVTAYSDGRDQVKKRANRTITIDEGDFKFVAGRMGLKPILSSSIKETNSSSSGRQVFRKNIGNRLKDRASIAVCINITINDGDVQVVLEEGRLSDR